MAVQEPRNAAYRVVLAMRDRLPTQRRVMMSVSFAFVAGFGVLLWYVYDLGFQRGTDGVVPVIKAARGPVKVKPEKPGGMEVPNQDKLVYGLLTKDSPTDVVERLLPPPETPVPKPPPPARQPIATPPGKTTPETPPNVADIQPAAGPATPESKTPAPSAKQFGAPKTKPTKPTKTAKAAPSPVATAPAKTGGNFRVQIASVRTAAAAAKGWQKLSRQHADLLKGLKSSIVRADLGRKGVYHRLQVGPVASREAAEGLCAKLKSRRVGCMIVRP